jgi:hypothetical protein
VDSDEEPAGLEDPPELEEPPELADGLPPDEFGELAAEEGTELGAAEAPETAGWQAATRADPRIAQMASDMLEFRIMSSTTMQPLKRLRQNPTEHC